MYAVPQKANMPDGEQVLNKRKANQAYISFPTTAAFRRKAIEAAEFAGMTLEDFAREAVEAYGPSQAA